MEGLNILSLNIRGIKESRHKLPKLRLLLSQHKTDFLFLQETNLDNNYRSQELVHVLGFNTGVFSGLGRGTGTGIIVISNRWKMVNHTVDNIEGRITTATVTNGTTTYTLVNIYAPALDTDRENFYLNLLPRLQAIKHKIVLGGDFNVCLHDSDITGTQLGGRNIGRHELQQIIDTFDLKDTYRDIFPTVTQADTTHRHLNGIDRESRIDRFYVQTAEAVTQCKHINDTQTHGFSDHKAELVAINVHTQHSKKSATWKFNDSLLDDPDYIEHQTYIIKRYILNPMPTKQFGLAWENAKMLQKQKTIEKATQINRNRKIRRAKLETEIENAYSAGTQNSPEVLEMREELENILEHIYKGAQIRSKQLMAADEAPTATYLAIEKGIQKAKTITEITDTHGTTHTTPDTVIKAITDFYETLYTAEETDDEVTEDFLKHVVTLTEEQKQTLDLELDFDILQTALKSLSTDSSPGPDGFTALYYRTFLPLLYPLFILMVKESFEEEHLPDSMNLSFITLLLKDPNFPRDIKNYRPISLLNVDYKIITKALTIKLSPVLSCLIHADQTCAVKGRNITQHNHLIRDIITYSHDTQTHACIVSVDQSKAFDRVNFDFMHKVLEKCNFGPYFRRWIRILYKNPMSCILINQTISRAINLTRSVRQGDPLSPLLYVLILEPVLNKIRSDKEIKGIILPGGDQKKLVAYADDANFFPTDKRSIKNILDTFRQYQKASGSKINTDKTQGLKIGKWKNKADDPFDDFHNWVDTIKIFGIYYRADRDPGTSKQWENIVDKIITTIPKLYYKRTTIFGRSILVNSLLEPKLNYLIQTLSPPKSQIKRASKEIRKFIFKGTIHKIRHSTLIQDKLHGGINLHDTWSKIDTYRLQYLKTITQNPDINPIAYYYSGLTLREYIPWDNNKTHFSEEYDSGFPTFYKHCFDIFNKEKLIFDTTQNSKDIYKQLIQKKRTPLNDGQIKRGRFYFEFDFLEPFDNLHKSNIPAFQKEIIYRILYNMTPTSEGLAKSKNKIQFCTICKNKNFQETEQHIFFLCRHTQAIRNTLSTQLNTLAGHRIDLYKIIFLNVTDVQDDTIKTEMLKSTAIYRQVVWQTRLDSKFHNRYYTPQQIQDIYAHRTKHMQ